MSKDNAAPTEPDYENMSDEDFMNLTFEEGVGTDQKEEAESEAAYVPQGGLLEERIDAAAAAASEEENQGDLENSEEGEQPKAGEQPAAKAANPDEEGATKGTEEDKTGDSKDFDHTTPHQTGEGDKKGEAKDDNGEKAADADGGSEDGTSETAENKDDAEPDYKALYEQVMGKFKANGREFQPSSPEEATRLMQMGANYTKKMQGLKPHLKMMRMLENNGLLTEDKINFLIDLEQKKPDAIQKLIHDGKIDPMEIDNSAEPAYTPGNHSVSDSEMAFQDVIQDVGSTDDGKKTISHVNDTWDPESKKAIYAEPQVLSIINEQRNSGVYDIISAEIDRQRTLGELQNVPFIHAYKQVGDRLQANGAFDHLTGSQPAQQQPAEQPKEEPKARQIVDTRTASSRKQMPNDDKARAASAGPKTSTPKKPAIDPFEMSDDQIMAIPIPQAL